MAGTAIDLSAGLEPAPQTVSSQPAQAIDLSGGLEPLGAPLTEKDAATSTYATQQASDKFQNLPAKDPSHVRFQAGDGSIHDVPAQYLDKAKQIDPNLKVLDTPGGGPSDPDIYDKLSNVEQGAKDSAVGKLAKDVMTPPSGADEHLALVALGPGGLPIYRQAKAFVDSAKNMLKATGDQYTNAVGDFQRLANEFKTGNYRDAASSAVSTASDVAGIADPTLTPLTAQTRELSEGARPGGNLARPLTRQLLDAGTAVVGGPKLGEVAGDVAEAGGKAIEGVNDLAGRAAKKSTQPNCVPSS
jgi:hypothetical protein